MILAVLDDLLFTSKIRATAAHLGVSVTFARSATAALDAMRANAPALVILQALHREGPARSQWRTVS